MCWNESQWSSNDLGTLHNTLGSASMQFREPWTCMSVTNMAIAVLNLIYQNHDPTNCARSLLLGYACFSAQTFYWWWDQSHWILESCEQHIQMSARSNGEPNRKIHSTSRLSRYSLLNSPNACMCFFLLLTFVSTVFPFFPFDLSIEKYTMNTWFLWR